MLKLKVKNKFAQFPILALYCTKLIWMSADGEVAGRRSRRRRKRSKRSQCDGANNGNGFSLDTVVAHRWLLGPPAAMIPAMISDSKKLYRPTFNSSPSPPLPFPRAEQSLSLLALKTLPTFLRSALRWQLNKFWVSSSSNDRELAESEGGRRAGALSRNFSSELVAWFS